MFWYRIKLCTVICLKLKRCSAAVTIPRRDVGLKHPRFQSVVEENVEAEQFVAAVATATLAVTALLMYASELHRSNTIINITFTPPPSTF